MMITKTSGTHLNTSYEDVQNQGIYPKDSLNTFGGKKIVQILAQRIYVVKWLYSGGTMKQKQPEKKLCFKLRCSENNSSGKGHFQPCI